VFEGVNGGGKSDLTGNPLQTVHCVPKKLSPLMFDNNFGKCGPIFRILSPEDL